MHPGAEVRSWLKRGVIRVVIGSNWRLGPGMIGESAKDSALRNPSRGSRRKESRGGWVLAAGRRGHFRKDAAREWGATASDLMGPENARTIYCHGSVRSLTGPHHLLSSLLLHWLLFPSLPPAPLLAQSLLVKMVPWPFFQLVSFLTTLFSRRALLVFRFNSIVFSHLGHSPPLQVPLLTGYLYLGVCY